MKTKTMSMWLRRIGPLSLAGFLALPGIAADAGSDGASPREVYQAQHDSLQKRFDEIENARLSALNMVTEGKYSEASVALKQLVKKVPGSGDMAKKMRSNIEKDIRYVDAVWTNSLMREAQKYARQKNYQKAIDLAQQAQTKSPDRAYIGNFIEECQKYKNAGEFKAETAMSKLDPDRSRRNSDVDLNLRKAKIFMRNSRYESACGCLEDVLAVSPFNVEAIDLLAKCYDRLFAIGKKRAQANMQRVDATAVWEWVEPIKDGVVAAAESTVYVRDRQNSDLYNRLERIVFPSLPFRNPTPLSQIIRYLNEKAPSYDPDKQGVAIIDSLSPEDKQRKVALDFGRISLLDIVRYLGMSSGFSYSFSGKNVVFGNVDPLVTERFPVRTDIISEIVNAQFVAKSSSGMKSGEDGGGSSESSGLQPTNEVTDAPQGPSAAEVAETSRTSSALMSYFEDRWVEFGEGANILYNKSTETLTVRNTPENLRRMDALLRQLNALEQPMIMVEVKLIELSDTNLNELGFEWLFSAKDIGSTKNGVWSMGTGDPLRHGTGEGLFRVLNNLKIFPNFSEKLFGSDMAVDLSLSINAVAQNRRSEVLASPRILTNSGRKTPSKIQMTDKTYFITEWEAPDVETSGFTLSLDTPEPEWDDGYDLGVTFSVKPSVGDDNYTITLTDINPVFLTHVGDEDNIVTFEAGQIINGQSVPVMQQTFNLRMPEIARREMKTTINIYDGETVLLGGMADNQTLARDDKWPLLGDIPLLGNLFRDQMTQVTNRTMLLFITARLVNADGVPLRSVKDRGLVDFNR